MLGGPRDYLFDDCSRDAFASSEFIAVNENGYGQMLAIGHCASIGGVTALDGTPPNLVMAGGQLTMTDTDEW